MVEEFLDIAFVGISALLLLGIGFNFVLAARLHSVAKDIASAGERSKDEAERMEERMKRIKEEILHRKGLVM